MERIYSIDYIKFFAIFAVVVIHVFPLDGFAGYFIIDNAARFAVPFFFAASGYFFAQKMKHEDVPFLYFKSYCIKLIKLYFVWLIFYTSYDVVLILQDRVHIEEKLRAYFKQFTLLNLLYYGKGTSGYQLWFLTALIWSTFAVYIFFRFKQITVLFMISFCLNLIGLLGQAYTMFVKLPINSTRDAMFFGLFYTTLGALFALNSRLSGLNKVSGQTFLGLALIGVVVQAMEGYILDKVLSGSHGEYFFSTILLTAFLFLFALNYKSLGKGLYVTKVGANALGIYIIHVFLLDVFNKFIKFVNLDHISENFFWNLCYTLFIFISSYFTYDYLQKIKRNIKQ
ncbi:surface polysaccharide O-acyltransferase-like enzyme [Fictibacillus halophilus]|uniref:Surface polysaccharide O-acyltransferase-like enzyme n=1 Tax=Fictibacillus halophilus TaxID=1610490 RepID=A0ABV2LIR7_9BACL|nr:acyltransferase [Fictibacillus halophilus]